MKDIQLTQSEIMDLIADYKSEIKKLNTKITFCRQKIEELETTLTNLEATSFPEIISKEIKATFATRNGLHTKRKELQPRKPHPLSEWDNIILEAVRENGRATLSKSIYEMGIEKAKANGLFTDEEKTKAKINQCLVKLANHRRDLVKIRYGGRGFAYCYPEWIDEKGKLKKEYAIIK